MVLHKGRYLRTVYWADCTSVRWFMYPGGDGLGSVSPYENIFNVHHNTTANRGHCPVLQLLARPYNMGCESCAFKLISDIYIYIFIWRKLNAAEYFWTNTGRWIYNRVQFFRVHITNTCDPPFNHTFCTHTHCHSVTRIFHEDTYLLCLSLTHTLTYTHRRVGLPFKSELAFKF